MLEAVRKHLELPRHCAGNSRVRGKEVSACPVPLPATLQLLQRRRLVTPLPESWIPVGVIPELDRVLPV